MVFCSEVTVWRQILRSRITATLPKSLLDTDWVEGLFAVHHEDSASLGMVEPRVGYLDTPGRWWGQVNWTWCHTND